MSGWFDSFNQAVGFTEDPAENARIAAEQQQATADRALNLQTEQYEYQKSLNQPFYNLGLPAYATLAATVTGKPSKYAAPGYNKLTDTEINALNAQWQKDHPEITATDYRRSITGPTILPYRQGGTYYRGPNGEIVTNIPQLEANPFNPQDTAAFKWQKERTLADLGRTLRMQGRGNSTAGLNATGRVLGDLNATEYDKQLGRLADLTNIARGGASALAGASAGFTNAAGQNLLGMGANQANATLAGGLMRQNSLYNNQQNTMGLANLGLKTYGYGKQQGWWGGDNDLSLGRGEGYGGNNMNMDDMYMTSSDAGY